jgi:hypothetical protein
MYIWGTFIIIPNNFLCVRDYTFERDAGPKLTCHVYTSFLYEYGAYKLKKLTKILKHSHLFLKS